jgi:hypothetical protein
LDRRRNMLGKLIFTHHAAMRWFERFPNAVFQVEMLSARRCRNQEKRSGKRSKCYRTISNIILVVRENMVVTCYRDKHLYKK